MKQIANHLLAAVLTLTIVVGGWQSPAGAAGVAAIGDPPPITNNTSVATVVDQFFSFAVTGRSGSCNGVNLTANATGSEVSFGRVARGTTGAAAQNLVVSSNAYGGFVVYQRGETLVGPKVIAGVTGTNGAPGAFDGDERFGYSTDDADLGRFAGPSWAAVSSSGAPVMTKPTGSIMSDSTCVVYQVGIAEETPGGFYATTVTYTAVPTF